MLNRKRIVLYSHDGKSYGHISKLGKFADALINRKSDISIFCISSSPFGSEFIKPFNRIDFLKLPSYFSVFDETNQTFSNKFFADLRKDEFYKIRKSILSSFFRYFRPGIIFMECNPLGKRNEMLEIIQRHKAKGGKVIWGINGILDPADYEFGNEKVMSFLDDHIDKILVYNQKEIVDVASDYPVLKRFSDRIQYVGYLCPPLVKSENQTPSMKKILIQTGGGGKSILLMRKLISVCIQLSDQLRDFSFQIFTGQYLPESEFIRHKEITAKYDNIVISRFTKNMVAELLDCHLFIGAGGYNTLSELIRYPRRSVIIPVQFDESEQKLHCERLLQLGVISSLLPFDAGEEVITKTITEVLQTKEPTHKIKINKNGIEHLVDEILLFTKE